MVDEEGSGGSVAGQGRRVDELARLFVDLQEDGVVVVENPQAVFGEDDADYATGPGL